MSRLLKLATLAALGLCAGWLSAQTMYVYPATVTAPRGTYQTVTAVVNGASNKTVTWSTDGGTIVGTNPCVVNEPCTAALYTTTPGTYHLTATSNANGTVHQTATITITGSPSPVTTHPRLYITQSMLAGLRAKFAAGSPMATAIKNQAIAYYTADNALWGWGGAGACGGTHSPPPGTTDNFYDRNANYYAFMALVDPSDATYNWNCYGHDVWMWWITNFNSANIQPGEDQWRPDAPAISFTTDWLIGSGAITTTGDLTTARAFVANALHYTVDPAHFGSAAWEPPNGSSNNSALYNNPLEFLGISKLRTMGNNYNLARDIYLAALPLTFNDDTTDDPPLTNTCSASRYHVCPDWTAGSMHAYNTYFTGAYLYDLFAHMEDPTVSVPALNAAFSNITSSVSCFDWKGDGELGTGSYAPCVGGGRGGKGSEGNGYGYSMYAPRMALNALWTAGYADPLACKQDDGSSHACPQVSLATSSWWDLHTVADLIELSGVEVKNGNLAGTSPGYSFYNDGDTLEYFRYPGWFLTESAINVFDTYTGRTDRAAMNKWPILNTAFGGPDGTGSGCSDHCGFNVNQLSNTFAQSISMDAFLAWPSGDPVTVSPPADPRPSLPTDWYVGGFAQSQIVRNGWTGGNANSYFSVNCGITMIDHEGGICGRIQVYFNNNYVTKGRVTFDDDYNKDMISARQSNSLSVRTTGTGCTTQCAGAYPSAAMGGLWYHGYEAALPTLLHSEASTYVADSVDMLGLYNGWNGTNYSDATAGSRDILYLRAANQVFTYDRGGGATSNDKAVYLNTTGTPTITGGTQATWLTPNGTTKAAWTNVFGGAGIINDGLVSSSDGYQANDWEVSTTLKVDLGTDPVTVQSLNMLEWGASTMTPSSSTAVHSTAGQNFDGAAVGANLVMFMRTWPAACTGATFPASGATAVYISDCTPNATYTITGTGTPATVTADNAGVLAFAAAGTGNISFTPGGAPPAPAGSVGSGSYSLSGNVTFTQ